MNALIEEFMQYGVWLMQFVDKSGIYDNWGSCFPGYFNQRQHLVTGYCRYVF